MNSARIRGLLGALLLAAAWPLLAKSNPMVQSLELVDSARVGRTLFEYEYRVLVNSADAVTGVTATVGSEASATTIVDAEVAFGDLEPGVTSASTDTFRLRHDRRVSFDPNALEFSFTFQPVITGPQPIVFDFDPNLTAVATIGAEGGRLVLDQPQGALLELEFPAGAFSEDTEVTLQDVFDAQNVPAGLNLLAAVRVLPSGAGFAGWARLRADLRALGSGAPVLGFLANDEGSELALLPIFGARLGPDGAHEGPYELLIPHFSVIGFIEALEGDLDLPPLPENASAGDRALHELAARLAQFERNEAAGIDDLFFNEGEAFGPLNEWINNPVDGILARANALAAGADRSNLQPVRDFILDLIIMRVDVIDGLVPVAALEFALVEDLEAMARQVMAAYLADIRGGCGEDTLLAFERTLELGMLQSNSPFDLDDLTGEQPCRIDVVLTPVEQATLAGEPALFDVTLTLQDGSMPEDVTLFSLPAPAGISLNPAMDVLPDGSLRLVQVPLGFTDIRVETNAGIAGFADVIGVPNLTGPYSATAAGTASVCLDDEDAGFERFSGNVLLLAQTITSASAAAGLANVRVSGFADAGGVEITLNVALRAGDDGELDGEVTGTASYEFVEVDVDEDGNPVEFEVAGSLTFTGSYEDGLFILFGSGSDNFCSLVQGVLTLGRQ